MSASNSSSNSLGPIELSRGRSSDYLQVFMDGLLQNSAAVCDRKERWFVSAWWELDIEFTGPVASGTLLVIEVD